MMRYAQVLGWLGQLAAALMMTVLRQVPPAELRARLPFRLDHDLADRLIDFFFVGHGKDPPPNKLGRLQHNLGRWNRTLKKGGALTGGMVPLTRYINVMLGLKYFLREYGAEDFGWMVRPPLSAVGVWVCV
jgi:hypothetical protein